MHDIAGYMLCSLELNMQALFMYTYMCVSVYFWFVCECVHARVMCVFAVQAFIVLAHCIHTCVLQCVSTVACLEAAEL